ncbi:PREDICTED: uncharacterized protein LOC108361142 isoform X2 [Rhagoletis zephyria]|uniref:uncharacterized protein LOC108361142 isoform X2 n=1 Tax=Rhagoletis zephyria TaxID=28612 RepID=UPI0008115C98|nr:PREDICTED: uncharacterized protein LOC108361142 isoform X2 [Rhagoletis zephyria]
MQELYLTKPTDAIVKIPAPANVDGHANDPDLHKKISLVIFVLSHLLVQGTLGKAKGIQFLVWDVGGQEKLRPLWRSYTRCTDGILFVVDSVDVERMEEAKMELMRTAKCPDNQGVPVLILANKQDLPGARNPKELEKLLGLHELLYPAVHLQSICASSSSTGNIVGCSSSSTSTINTFSRSMTPTSQHSKSFGYSGESGFSKDGLTRNLKIQFSASSSTAAATSNPVGNESEHYLNDEFSNTGERHTSSMLNKTTQDKNLTYESSPSSVVTTPTATASNTLFLQKKATKTTSYSAALHQFKGWYIQPACAITGEGLQEGLEALYEMILKRRKLNKTFKKKR